VADKDLFKKQRPGDCANCLQIDRFADNKFRDLYYLTNIFANWYLEAGACAHAHGIDDGAFDRGAMLSGCMARPGSIAAHTLNTLITPVLRSANLRNHPGQRAILVAEIKPQTC